MQTLLRYVIKIASAVTIMLTLFSYICPLVDPSVFQWLAFFGTAFPWLLIFNILLLLFWIWDFNRFALYHVGILIFGIQHITGFIGIDYESNHVPERAITVATHNLGGIYPEKPPARSGARNAFLPTQRCSRKMASRIFSAHRRPVESFTAS